MNNENRVLLSHYNEINKILDEFSVSWYSFVLGCYIVILKKTYRQEEQHVNVFEDGSFHCAVYSVDDGMKFIELLKNIEQSEIPGTKKAADPAYPFFCYAPAECGPDAFDHAALFLSCGMGRSGVEFCFSKKDADPDMTALMSKRLYRITEEFLLDNYKNVGDITVIGDDELQYLKRIAKGHSCHVPDITFHKLFEKCAKNAPRNTAVICGDDSITYEELNSRANQVAHYIAGSKIGSEKLIGIFMERSIEFVIAVLGIMKSGNGYVPIDPDTLNPGRSGFPKKRLEFMLDDLKVQLIITKQQYLQYIGRNIYNILCIENFYKEKYPTTNLDLPVAKDNMIYGIYTSGSTGYPKLTIVEHHSVINLLSSIDKNIYSGLPQKEQQVVSLNAPFGFDASVQQLIGLLKGYCLCIIPEKVRNSVNATINYINEKKINIFDCTPSQLNLLIGDGLLEKCRETLDLILVGGEAISPKMWSRLSKEDKIKVYNMYGPTECTVDSTFCLVNASKYDTQVIGRPVDNCRIYILDENRDPVPAGSRGEIYIAGNGVARCYLNRNELNKACFINQPRKFPNESHMYKTGDQGRYLCDGTIAYLGRLDSQVKIRSHRIELAEISAVLEKHQNVKDSVVVVNNDGGYDKLIAYLILVDEKKYDFKGLSDFLAKYVPEYMVPNNYVVMKSWPLTANKKIDRARLPLPKNDRPENSDGNAALSDELELNIAGMMKNILNVEKIGADESFMSLGGDSLRVMTLLAEIFNTYKVEIDFAEFFDHPTILFVKEKIAGAGKRNAT